MFWKLSILSTYYLLLMVEGYRLVWYPRDSQPELKLDINTKYHQPPSSITRQPKQLIEASVVTSVSVVKKDDPDFMKQKYENEYQESLRRKSNASVLVPKFQFYLYNDDGQLVREKLSIHDIQQLLLQQTQNIGLAKRGWLIGRNLSHTKLDETTTTTITTTTGAIFSSGNRYQVDQEVRGVLDKIHGIIANAKIKNSNEFYIPNDVSIDQIGQTRGGLTTTTESTSFKTETIMLKQENLDDLISAPSRPIVKERLQDTLIESISWVNPFRKQQIATLESDLNSRTEISVIPQLAQYSDLLDDDDEVEPQTNKDENYQDNNNNNNNSKVHQHHKEKKNNHVKSHENHHDPHGNNHEKNNENHDDDEDNHEEYHENHHNEMDNHEERHGNHHNENVNNAAEHHGNHDHHHHETDEEHHQMNHYQHEVKEHEHHHEHHHHHEHTHEPTSKFNTFPIPPEDNLGLYSTTKSLNRNLRHFVDINNDLGISIYKRVILQERFTNVNFCFSPLSTASTLSMVFLGARGSTSWQMNELLHLDEMISFNPHLIYKNLMESLRKDGNSAFVKQLLVDQDEDPLIEFYKARVEYFYNGQVNQVNFSNIDEEYHQRLNQLMAKASNNKLVNITTNQDSFRSNPPMAVAAASYIKGEFELKTSASIGEMNFINLAALQRRLVPVTALSLKGSFNAAYDSELDATAAEIPLSKPSNLSLILILPGKQGEFVADGLNILESKLNSSSWNALMKKFYPVNDISIQFPFFHHRILANLNETLISLGTENAFGTADFTGINGGKDLRMSSFWELTHIEMSPPATMTNIKNVREQKYKLFFERQFLYALRHNPTGLIVFMGRYCKPQ